MIKFLPENRSWQAELWNPLECEIQRIRAKPNSDIHWIVWEVRLGIPIAIGDDPSELGRWLRMKHYRDTRTEMENIYGVKFEEKAWDRVDELINEDCDGMDAGRWLQILEMLHSTRETSPIVEDNLEDMLRTALRLMASIEARGMLNPDADRGARERIRGVVREIFTDYLDLQKERPYNAKD